MHFDTVMGMAANRKTAAKRSTSARSSDADRTGAGRRSSLPLPPIPSQGKAHTPSRATAPSPTKAKAGTLSSKLSFQGHVFSVYTDDVLEPNGVRATRDVVRHNGSVVVLAVDDTADPADPVIVLEKQYRHAAGQYLLELPAGRVEPGEKTLAAAKRELIEETGYRAKKWRRLVRYYASPGFVAEWMEIFLATGITAGTAAPEEDERIELRHVRLSEALEMARSGKIHDGKTLIGTLLYAEHLRRGSR